tara:strand:+ start:10349 stop:11233 length:885 start_codon:yes stop_codon:yes gene_type:complete
MVNNSQEDSQEDLEEEYANQISFNIIRYGPTFDIFTLNMSLHPLFSNYAFLNNQRLLDLIKRKLLDSFIVDEDREDDNEIEEEDPRALNLFETFKRHNQQRYNNNDREDININIRRPRTPVTAPNQQVMFRQRRAIGPSSRTPSPMIVRNNILQSRTDNISQPLPRVQVLPLGVIPEDILNTIPENVQEILEDKVSLEIMTDPVINSQGQTYNRSTMERIIAQARIDGISPKDPITKQIIGSELIPNMFVRSLIQMYYPQAGGSSKKKKKTTRKKKFQKKSKEKRKKTLSKRYK